MSPRMQTPLLCLPSVSPFRRPVAVLMMTESWRQGSGFLSPRPCLVQREQATVATSTRASVLRLPWLGDLNSVPTPDSDERSEACFGQWGLAARAGGSISLLHASCPVRRLPIPPRWPSSRRRGLPVTLPAVVSTLSCGHSHPCSYCFPEVPYCQRDLLIS